MFNSKRIVGLAGVLACLLVGGLAERALATPIATGGIITFVNGREVHTFTGSGTLTLFADAAEVEYLVVAGGAGGGWDVGGGGGAGGFRTGTFSFLSATSYTIAVGAGGSGAITSGQNPTLQNGSNSSIAALVVSLGGGGGGNYSGGNGAGAASGLNGSGGGSSGYTSPGLPGFGTAGQGNNGGLTGGPAADTLTGSGGGGAGGVGATGINVPLKVGVVPGGPGLASSISGSPVIYAAGGRGAGDNWPGPYVIGAANTGNGGDGGGIVNAGSAGGSGIVIVSFAPPVPEPSTFALLGLGAIGLAIKARRRRAAA